MSKLTDSTHPTCATCYHWRPSLTAGHRGLCTALPPTPAPPGPDDDPDESFPLGVWPFTEADEYCGSHLSEDAWP